MVSVKTKHIHHLKLIGGMSYYKQQNKNVHSQVIINGKLAM